MSGSRNRVEVLHGVNLDMLGRRDPEVYGDPTLTELEFRVQRLGARARPRGGFFQTNHEGEFSSTCTGCPRPPTRALINAGAWTHYSWAIRDALEVAGEPAGRGPPLDVQSREDWRRGLGVRRPRRRRRLRQGRRRLPRGARAAGARARPVSRRRPRRAPQPTLVAERGARPVIVGDLVNPGDSGREAMADVRWLTGFTGTSGLALVGAEARAVRHRLPLHRAGAAQVRTGFERASAKARAAARARRAPRAAGSASTRRRPASRLPQARARRSARASSSSRAGASSSACAGSRTRPRSRRSPRPPRSPTRSTQSIAERGLAGRTEREVALRRRGADARAGRRGPVLPADRRRRARTARCRTPSPGEREIGARRARRRRHGRDRRRLLLRLHADLRRRRARRRGGARSTSSSARRSRRRWTAVRPASRGRDADAVAARDRSTRPATASIRPRARATASGSRSTRRRASASAPRTTWSRATSSRSSRASTCPGARRPDRGPGRGHRGRAP